MKNKVLDKALPPRVAFAAAGASQPMLIECVLLSASLCHALKDKPVLALTGLHAASAIADGITTKQFESRGFVEGESAFILGKRPTVGRMTLVLGSEVTVETWIAERMHRSHSWVRHVWW